MRRSCFLIPALIVLALVVWIILAANRGTLPDILAKAYDFPFGDKIGHFLVMGLLSFVILLAMPVRWKWVGLVLLALAVTAEEFSQALLSRRTFSLADLFFSLTGILFFGLMSILVEKGVRTMDDGPQSGHDEYMS